MIVKIKNGMVVCVNGDAHFVSGTSMRSVGTSGLCDDVSLELTSHTTGEKIELKFSPTVFSIGDRDLDGLVSMLANSS